MKKVSLMLSAVFLTSMLMTGFAVSGQALVYDDQQTEEQESARFKKSDSEQELTGKPLRFVMYIGMTNLPGDKVNPICYSNVITLPGPPGWGEKGWLPAGSAEKARKDIESYKERFCAACEAGSGRKITGTGNFSYVMNQYEDQEELILKTHAKYREDVSVTLQ